MTIDLTIAMHETPTIVRAESPAPQAFRTFRFLCLRHLLVTDQVGKLKGIITRTCFQHVGEKHALATSPSEYSLHIAEDASDDTTDLVGSGIQSRESHDV